MMLAMRAASSSKWRISSGPDSRNTGTRPRPPTPGSCSGASCASICLIAKRMTSESRAPSRSARRLMWRTSLRLIRIDTACLRVPDTVRSSLVTARPGVTRRRAPNTGRCMPSVEDHDHGFRCQTLEAFVTVYPSTPMQGARPLAPAVSIFDRMLFVRYRTENSLILLKHALKHARDLMSQRSQAYDSYVNFWRHARHTPRCATGADARAAATGTARRRSNRPSGNSPNSAAGNSSLRAAASSARSRASLRSDRRRSSAGSSS